MSGVDQYGAREALAVIFCDATTWSLGLALLNCVDELCSDPYLDNSDPRYRTFHELYKRMWSDEAVEVMACL